MIFDYTSVFHTTLQKQKNKFNTKQHQQILQKKIKLKK